MKKIIVTFLIICVTLNSNSQNQFHMGQYAIYQPFLNPATIGVYENINFALLYKKQWLGLKGSPHLQGFNFNMPVGKKKKSYLSLNVLNDRIGINNSSEISGTYAYKIKAKRHRLIFGLTGSLNLVSSQLGTTTTIETGDPVYTTNTPVYLLPNFKFGTYYYRKKYYLGFVIPNLLENKVIESNGSPEGYFGFNPKNLHYYLHGGFKTKFNSRHILVTSTLIKQVLGSPLQIDLNLNYMYKNRFGIGTNIRSSKDVMLMLSAYLLPELLLSYGYEYSFSKLSQFNSGTHEILLVYKVKGKRGMIATPMF